MSITEQTCVDGSMSNHAAIVAAWTPEERAIREKKLLRKIDLRLLPILVSNHFASFATVINDARVFLNIC
jgi:hypothetical protein